MNKTTKDETNTHIEEEKTFITGNRSLVNFKTKIHGTSFSTGGTRLYIPENLVRHAIGRGGRTMKKIMEETNTYIRAEEVDGKTCIVIEGRSEGQHQAKLKLKMQARMGKIKSKGIQVNFFTCVDFQEGTFVLHPINNGDHLKLVLKSSSNEDSVGTGNCKLLFQKLPNILRKYEAENRNLNVWCHFGTIHIKNCPDVQGKEYTLSEIENHVSPKGYLAHDETKWILKFYSGLNATEQKSSALDKWFSPKEQICPRYRRHEMTFLTPSCFELRLKVFFIPEQTASNEQEIRYQSAKCPHEIHDVIVSSDSPPYFYICDSTPKRDLFDIFEPSAQVDIRLIAEATFKSPSSLEDEQRQEALMLYNYVKKNLKITEQGEMNLSQEKIPKDFDVRYSRVSERSSYRVRSPDGKQFTARLSNESHGDVQGFDDLDIHLLINNCSSMTSKQVIEQVPHLLNCARRLARVFENESDQNIVPSEILAHGQRAQSAYQTALKSGKVKNCRVPIVLVGQSRSGKTKKKKMLTGTKPTLTNT